MQRQKCENFMLTILISQNSGELYNLNITEDHLIYIKTLSALFSLLFYNENIAVLYNKTITETITTILLYIRNTTSYICIIQMLKWEKNFITNYLLTILYSSSLSDEASDLISSMQHCSENLMYF